MKFARLKDRLLNPSHQLMAVVAASIGTVTDGMAYAWASPIVPILKAPGSPVPIQESDVMWLELLYMIGAISCLPLTIYLSDHCGRKAPLILASALNLLHWIILAYCKNLPLLFAMRYLTGLASNMIYVPGPMYIAEVAEEKIRGFYGCFIFIMQFVGILILYSVAPFVTIAVSSSVAAIFPCLQLMTLPFMPETPYFLFTKGKEEEAKKALQFLRETEDVDKELQEIKLAVQRQQAENGNLWKLVSVKSNRKAFIITLSQAAAQHFSGITVIAMNLHTILTDARGILGSNSSSIIFSATMLVVSLISAGILDKVGRRILLVSTSVLTGLALGALATYFAVKNAGINVTAYNWVPLAAVLLYAAAFKFGLGLIPSVLNAEIFPTSVKAYGMCLTDGMFVFFAGVTIYLYLYLAEHYGVHVPLFLFTAWALLNSVFVYLVIPETKGKTLEEIQMVLKGIDYKPSTNGVNEDAEKTETEVKTSL